MERCVRLQPTGQTVKGAHSKVFITEEENLLLVTFAPRGGSRAAAAWSPEEAIYTPQHLVQMELTRGLERGVERTEMCSSVKLKVVQHDVQHYLLGVSQKQ